MHSLVRHKTGAGCPASLSPAGLSTGPSKITNLGGQTMKRNLVMLAVSIICIFGFSIIANAQTDRHRSRSINAREARQERRIDQGIYSGELTKNEIRRLEREQNRIDRVEDRYRTSGDGLSPRERERLQRALNHSSRDIYRQKHDRQDRGRL